MVAIWSESRQAWRRFGPVLAYTPTQAEARIYRTAPPLAPDERARPLETLPGGPAWLQWFASVGGHP